MATGDPICGFCGQYIYTNGGCGNFACPGKTNIPSWPEVSPFQPPIPIAPLGADPFAIQNLTQRIEALEKAIRELTEELKNTKKKKTPKTILQG